MKTATPENMAGLVALWRECFGDTMEYTDFIFKRLIKPEHSVFYMKGDYITAMLFYQPFLLKMRSEERKGAYIYGVATDPAHRGMGLSTKLLEDTHKRLIERGFALSILVPASESLFEFYAKRGYANFSGINRLKIDADSVETKRLGTVKLTPVRLADHIEIRESYFSNSKAFVSWDSEYLNYVGDECSHFGGETLLIQSDGVQGYAVCHIFNDTVYVKELALHGRLFKIAAGALHGWFGAKRYIYSLPSDYDIDKRTVLPYSMIKWYDKDMYADSLNDMNDGCQQPYIAFTLD